MTEVTVVAAVALLLGVVSGLAAARRAQAGARLVSLLLWSAGSLALAVLLGALVLLGLLVGDQR